MSGGAAKFAVFPGGHPAQPDGAQDRTIQELWFAIARQPWASLVLVPADPEIETGPIATALADVGTRLRDTPVNAIVADTLDYGSARALSELQPRLRAEAWEPATELDVVTPTSAAPLAPSESRPAPREAKLLPPLGRAIIAIQAVVAEPLGVAIAHAADAIVVCVRLGSTRAAAVRRTLQLIGEDRVIGAILVR